MKRTFLAGVAVAALAILPAHLLAQTPAAPDQPKMDHSKMDQMKMDHSKMGHAAAATVSDTPSTIAYKAANHKMHSAMDIKFSGNADVDFINGMIPHHQGAVEMAKIVLQHGKDPKLKKLAGKIVAAQDKEIAVMQAWLKSKGK